MSETFEQRAIDQYREFCGDSGLRTFEGLIPKIRKAYPMGPNGEDMYMALRAIYALADAASWQRESEIDKFLERNCPRVPEAFEFSPANALMTLNDWTNKGISEGIGVRGISVEALARILRQGGIAPRYIGEKWQVEFTPYTQTILEEAESAGVSTNRIRWARDMSDAEAIQGNRSFAKTNAVIARLREDLPLTFEFDGNGRQKDYDEPVTAYDFTYRHLDGERVRTYEPDERTMKLAAEQGFDGKGLRKVLRRALDVEGVQIALSSRVLHDCDVTLFDTSAGTAIVRPRNEPLSLEYITGIEFMGKPNDTHLSQEHAKFEKLLKKAIKC
jgi:hypothetical protein